MMLKSWSVPFSLRVSGAVLAFWSRSQWRCWPSCLNSFFFFNDTATTEIYTLSLHDALPISLRLPLVPRNGCGRPGRAPERFLPLDITSLLLHVIFDARFLLRQ